MLHARERKLSRKLREVNYLSRTESVRFPGVNAKVNGAVYGALSEVVCSADIICCVPGCPRHPASLITRQERPDNCNAGHEDSAIGRCARNLQDSLDVDRLAAVDICVSAAQAAMSSRRAIAHSRYDDVRERRYRDRDKCRASLCVWCGVWNERSSVLPLPAKVFIDKAVQVGMFQVDLAPVLWINNELYRQYVRSGT